MKLMADCGLPEDQIKQLNVNVGVHEGKSIYLHTLILGDHEEIEKPILVLVHGYASSGALLNNIFAPLVKKFRLITFDLPGFGGSSRGGDIDCEKLNAQQTLNYYLKLIEMWRQEMCLEQFFVAAHSFGGFIMGNYALKHPEHITKVIMLSPIGVRYDEQYSALSEVDRKVFFHEQ